MSFYMMSDEMLTIISGFFFASGFLFNYLIAYIARWYNGWVKQE